MTLREIRRARRKLRLAGAPQDREQILLSLIGRTQYELDLLRQQIVGLAADFRRWLMSWLGIEVSDTTMPHALLADVRIARLYGTAALAALVGEMLLAGWFFHQNEIDWRVGAASVGVVTLIFHASIFYMAYGSEGRIRPRETLFQLRLFIWPASALFFIAVILGVLPRYLEGEAAANQDVHNLLSAGLLTGTISMLVLSAALGCAHFVYNTTKRFADEYGALLGEQRMTEAFQAELERQLPPAAPITSAPAAIPTPPVPSGFGAATATGPVILLALTALTLSACTSGVSAADAPPAVNRAALPSCEVEADTSGSPIELDALWAESKTNVTAMVRRFHCGTVTVSAFDLDGWRPRLLKTIELPVMPEVSLPVLRSEFADMKNVRDARAERVRRLRADAEREYEARLGDALVGLDHVKFLPTPDYETAGSDVVGAIRRYAEYRGKRLRIVLVLSDFGDTTHARLPAIATPSGNIRVIAAVLPMKPKDAQLIGEAQTTADQYLGRSRWLKGGAPWIVAAPYFADDMVDLLASSRASE